MHLRIELLHQPFQPFSSLEQWHRQLHAQGHTSSAAEGLFIGRMRAHAADGSELEALELKHYPGMSERHLEQLAHACGARHHASSCLVQHRVGLVQPGEAIVLVAIGADRRGPAQRCCQELLEALKYDAPFWKREWRSDGSSEWLSANTPL